MHTVHSKEFFVVSGRGRPSQGICTCMYIFPHVHTFVCISQALMQDAEKTPNVVKACNKPGLYETLEDIQKRYFFSLV